MVCQPCLLQWAQDTRTGLISNVEISAAEFNKDTRSVSRGLTTSTVSEGHLAPHRLFAAMFIAFAVNAEEPKESGVKAPSPG